MKIKSITVEFAESKQETVSDILRYISDRMTPKAVVKPAETIMLPSAQLPKEQAKSPALPPTTNHSYNSVGWQPRIEKALKALGKPATYKEIVTLSLGDAAHKSDFTTCIGYLKNLELNHKVRKAGHAKGGTTLWELVA